jgi:hypothetical protein
MQSQILALADEVAAVFREFRTCEFTTIAKDDTPVSWPTVFLYQPAKTNFLITTSIGLPQKAYNIRHNRCVSLFFSNPTVSGLNAPAAMLVQGDAQAPDEVATAAPADLLPSRMRPKFTSLILRLPMKSTQRLRWKG